MDLAKLHSTILEDQSEEDSRTIIAAMKSLFESPGWNVLAKYMEVYYRSEIADISASPLASMDGVLPQEYRKGAASAILLLLQLPEMLTTNAENNLHMTAPQQEALGDGDNGWSTESI